MNKKFEQNKGVEGMFSSLENIEELSTPLKEEQKKGGRPRINKKNPYKLTITIDEDIEEFMKNVPYFTMKDRKAYINELIRKDFYKRIGTTEIIPTNEEVQMKWREYKEKVKDILSGM